MPVINIHNEFFNQDAQAGGFFPETHTNPGFDIRKFISETGKNYLIEGIRGTGKTHILKMINELCIKEYDQRKILPIYISLAKVSEWIEKDLSLFRIHMYANIVLASINTLERYRGKIELAGNPEFLKALKRIVQMFGLNEEEDFDKVIKIIKDLHKTLLNKLTYNPDEFNDKELEKSSVGGEVGVSIPSAQFTFKDVFNRIEQKEVRYIGKTLSHENASSFIIEFFYQLKQILKHKYSLILLDECSEVSQTAQIEVFRLLKLIRGAFGDSNFENTAYFCASVYPTPVTYYPSRIIGDSFNFDVGHDAIMEFLQLDELSDEYLDFFKELTKKRISYVFKKPIKECDHLEIFDSEKAFILASYFSNGIIRRYFEILKHSYDNLCQRIGENATGDEKKIAAKDIEESINNIVASQILAQNKLLQPDMVILDDIAARITKRNKKNETENKEKDKENQIPANVYFTVSRSEATYLGRLIIQGALHDKGKTRLKKYHKEGGVRGALIMIDLSVAFNYGAIDRIRTSDIFLKELKNNAKSGYLWCQDFLIPKPEQIKLIADK